MCEASPTTPCGAAPPARTSTAGRTAPKPRIPLPYATGALLAALFAVATLLLLPAPPAAAADTPCVSHCDCPRGELCSADTGTCEGVVCTREYRPVCGLDGRTYGNRCAAEANHVVVAHEGECRDDPADGWDGDGGDGNGDGQPGATCGGIAGQGCPEGEVCDPPPGQCRGADLQGECVPRPDLCTEEYRPVCGCDGETYGNDCKRLQAGAQKAHDGECGEPPEPPGDDPPDGPEGPGDPDAPVPGPPGDAPRGCESNDDCAATAYCEHPGFSCEGRGQCVPRPDVCAQVWEPVCGCDGNTYPNACSAAANGVSVAAEGECA